VPVEHPLPTGSLLPSIGKRLRRCQDCGVDETIASRDGMFQSHRREHYFAVGRGAVAIVALAMLKAGVEEFGTVLDLPCGAGRVLRHLVRFLPDSSFIASDIERDYVEFCARQFGAEPLLSQEDLRDVDPDRPIDLLWCGSLLTHVSADRFDDALRHMIGWLSPGGIAIFTLHGRWSARRQAETPYKYLDDGAFAPIFEGLTRDGFGYADYPNRPHRFGERGYGISISLPHWVTRKVEAIEDVRLLDYTERGWDNHQDVLIVRKVPIGARPWIFEDRLEDTQVGVRLG
jgi:SAM-dependent methyltransferase